MFRLFVLLASALALPTDQPLSEDFPVTDSSGNESLPEVEDRIVGGSPAKLGQFPYQAALYLKDSDGKMFFCSGALIAPRYILTAAHCIEGSIETVLVELGTIRLDDKSGGFQVYASQGFSHPNYSPKSIANDIAVLELSKSVPMSANIQTIRLASDKLGVGVSVTLSGWGKTSSTSAVSKTLNHVKLTTISNAVCKNYESTCSGDSGGPMVTGSGSSALHVGIVSFGSSKGCDKGYPTVYTRTAAYRAWIREHANV
ncbi:serine protease P150 [Tribolium castaneum]|uniref:Serine protease P150 n=1 Tax=Tribolium castaneum TaxID=7070 RepID=D2A3X1_TRICA|nr:serine protease P150 [Tribolium castaneum]